MKFEGDLSRKKADLETIFNPYVDEVNYSEDELTKWIK